MQELDAKSQKVLDTLKGVYCLFIKYGENDRAERTLKIIQNQETFYYRHGKKLEFTL
jgi:hypothetical protein